MLLVLLPRQCSLLLIQTFAEHLLLFLSTGWAEDVENGSWLAAKERVDVSWLLQAKVNIVIEVATCDTAD